MVFPSLPHLPVTYNPRTQSLKLQLFMFCKMHISQKTAGIWHFHFINVRFMGRNSSCNWKTKSER